MGWAAEGRFWALNNMIAQSDECILDLNRKNLKATVMSDLGLKEDDFIEFITVLKNDCELIIDLNGRITTETVRENLKEVMKEREAARLRKLKSQSQSRKKDEFPNIFGLNTK